MSKPKDDLISRDAAIEELMGWVDHEHEMIHWTGIKAMLECLPGVDAVPVQEPRVMTLEEIRSALKRQSAPTKICMPGGCWRMTFRRA